jgi:hypothetical protein
MSRGWLARRSLSESISLAGFACRETESTPVYQGIGNHNAVDSRQTFVSGYTLLYMSVGKARPRPDIIIESTVRGRPEFVFEAKRLRKAGFGAGKYIGDDGMGRFISGLYAARYDEAAMLGYVQSDSLVHWRDRIQSAINDDSKRLRLRLPQRDERVIDAFPLEWASEHDRDSTNRPISIYHVLLDCC